MAKEARGSGRELSGPVSPGCFVTLAPLHLPPLLTAVADAHPEVEVRVLEDEADELATALRGGRIDFALAWQGGEHLGGAGLGHGVLAGDVVEEGLLADPGDADDAGDAGLAVAAAVARAEIF